MSGGIVLIAFLLVVGTYRAIKRARCRHDYEDARRRGIPVKRCTKCRKTLQIE